MADVVHMLPHGASNEDQGVRHMMDLKLKYRVPFLIRELVSMIYILCLDSIIGNESKPVNSYETHFIYS